MLGMITGLSATGYSVLYVWAYASGALVGFGQRWERDFDAARALLWPVVVGVDLLDWALSNLATYFFPAARCADCGRKVRRISYVCLFLRYDAEGYPHQWDPLCRSCWEDAVEKWCGAVVW